TTRRKLYKNNCRAKERNRNSKEQEMRKFHFLCLLIPIFSWSQTNTFPSSGNVGIGTSAPTESLDVRGIIKLEMANNEENNSPGIVAMGNDDFLYDGQYINHYGFGFHGYN